MEYRPLGSTGLQVSKLALGGAQLGGGYGEITYENVVRIVRGALDQGINLIDTSPFYGVTRSETVLGQALADVPRDHYIMATKCGRYGDADFDFSAERLTRSVDESLRRLGIDYIDVFQIHDIEFGSLEQIVNEALPAVAKIKQSGKVGFIGVTGLPLKIFEYIIPRFSIDTIISYTHFSLIDTTLTRLLPLAASKGIGVMNASPVVLGLLSEKGPQPWHPAPAPLKAFVADVVAKWHAKGVSLAKLSLQYSMANPQISSTVSGMATLAEVLDSIAAANEPLDPELLAAVLADFAPVANSTWVSGHPENNDLQALPPSRS